jgi:uroporphyrinogen-III synthase
MVLQMDSNRPDVILTRPLRASSLLADRLTQTGLFGRICISPLISTAINDVTVDVSDVDGVIFTSANAANSVGGHKKTAWCVGDSTARAARDKGWLAKSVDGDVETLFRRIVAEGQGQRLIHLRGDHSLGDLAPRLSNAGIYARELITYRQLTHDLTSEAKQRLSREKPVIVPLYSPRTARQFVLQAPFEAPLITACMSEQVEVELQNLLQVACIVSNRPTGDGMLEAINLAKDVYCRIAGDAKQA